MSFDSIRHPAHALTDQGFGLFYLERLAELS
jgi:hypothetical protein